MFHQHHRKKNWRLADTDLQLDRNGTVTATPCCTFEERPVKETCAAGREASTWTPGGHETALKETSETISPTTTADLSTEYCLPVPSTTKVSENQFKVVSGTASITLTPEEQKLTLAETNQSETSVTTSSSCASDERLAKETCLVGQEIANLTPKGYDTTLKETSRNTRSDRYKGAFIP